MIIYKNGIGSIVDNKAAFAREYDLNYQLLLKLLKGDVKSHKGWTLNKEVNTEVIYKLYDVDGVEHSFSNKVGFAKQHNLNYLCLLKLLKGEASHHKGWTLDDAEIEVETFTLYDSNGVEHSFSNKSAFVREHGLHYNCLLKLLKGEASHHKGWTLKPCVDVEICKLYDVYSVEHSFSNKAAFAKKHGLGYSSLFKLLRGEIKSHKGWTLNKLKLRNQIVDPEGVERVVVDLKIFCELYGLNVISIKRILTGEIRSYNGWTVNN